MNISQFFDLMQQARHIPVIKLVLKMDIPQLKEEPKEETKEYGPIDEDIDSDFASLLKSDESSIGFNGNNYNIQLLSFTGINKDNSPWNEDNIQFIIEAISRSKIKDNLKIFMINRKDICKDKLTVFAKSKGLDNIKIFTKTYFKEYYKEGKKLLLSLMKK